LLECGLLELFRLIFSSRTALIAENLFLRKQLTLFLEREIKPRRTTPALRLTLIALSRFFNWHEALVIVKPETFLKWHRTAFRRFWRWKSRRPCGRPALPSNIRHLIRRIASENPTWGEERIANDLSLKLGIKVSPRTVRKYIGPHRPGRSTGQRWSTFVGNHAKIIIACEFFVFVAATFRVL
jgi:putative transposase